MTDLMTFSVVVLLLAAGAWDAWVLLVVEQGPLAQRLSSGLTVSYQTYVAAQTYPAVSWLFGFLSATVASYAAHEAALAWWLVQGHIFFTMRDVN